MEMKLETKVKITTDFLHERYFYSDGELFYRYHIPHTKIYYGDLVGTTGKTGYKKTLINKKPFSLNKLIWCFHGGDYYQTLDHIDRNPSNNRIENLRPASSSENNLNRGVQKRNKLGVKGVCLIGGSKFKAALMVCGVKHHLGYFDSLEKAKQAHILATKKYCPEFGAI